MTQCEKIMKHLETGASLTAWEAMRDYGIMRLASRISDLRRDGQPISREMVKGKNRFGDPISFAAYRLEVTANDEKSERISAV